MCTRWRTRMLMRERARELGTFRGEGLGTRDQGVVILLLLFYCCSCSYSTAALFCKFSIIRAND